jgi:RimJ/RimL family protein N-acetyltransferase
VLVRLGQEVQEVPRRLSAPSPPLADDAIRLEPLDERYVPDFDRLLADPEVLRNTRVPSPPPPAFASDWVGRYEEGWQDGSRAGFAILSAEGVFLGFGGVVDLDLEARQGEIGYVVAAEARGRGVAGRALGLITGWALDDLGLGRVELHIDPANAASIRVAERCAYVREGVLRSLHFKGDLRADTVIYSLLPTDPRSGSAAQRTPHHTPARGGG